MIRISEWLWKHRLLLVVYATCVFYFDLFVLLSHPLWNIDTQILFLNGTTLPVWVGGFIWYFKTGFKDIFERGEDVMECNVKKLKKDLRKAEKERDAQKAASIINLLVKCEEDKND